MKALAKLEVTLYHSEGASIGGATIFNGGCTKKEGTHAHIKVKAKNGEGASIKWTHVKMEERHILEVGASAL